MLKQSTRALNLKSEEEEEPLPSCSLQCVSADPFSQAVFKTLQASRWPNNVPLLTGPFEGSNIKLPPGAAEVDLQKRTVLLHHLQASDTLQLIKTVLTANFLASLKTEADMGTHLANVCSTLSAVQTKMMPVTKALSKSWSDH